MDATNRQRNNNGGSQSCSLLKCQSVYWILATGDRCVYHRYRSIEIFFAATDSTKSGFVILVQFEGWKMRNFCFRSSSRIPYTRLGKKLVENILRRHFVVSSFNITLITWHHKWNILFLQLYESSVPGWSEASISSVKLFHTLVFCGIC